MTHYRTYVVLVFIVRILATDRETYLAYEESSENVKLRVYTISIPVPIYFQYFSVLKKYLQEFALFILQHIEPLLSYDSQNNAHC
jgi:hypothetical protein